MKFRFFILLMFFISAVIFGQDSDDSFSMDLFADPEQNKENSSDDFEMNLFEDQEDSADDESLPLFETESEDNGTMDILDEEDENEDSLSLFEDTDSTSKPPSFFEAIQENFSGFLLTRYNWFFFPLEVEENASPEPDDKQHVFENLLSFETYYRDTFWQLNAALDINFGNQDNCYIAAFNNLEEQDWQDWFQDTRRERRYLTVNELYLSLYASDFDIFIGKKKYYNTLSILYSPANIYTPTDLNSPFNPRYIGRYMLEFDYYIGPATLSTVIFPIYQGSKTFSPLSRWGYYKAKELQDEEGVTIEDEEDSETDKRYYPDITWENISYLVKAKSNFSGLDIFISGFYGLAGNTVTKTVTNEDNEEETETEVVPVLQGAAGFSGTIERLELHGETLFNYSLEKKDDTYLRYVGGLRYGIDGFPDLFPLNKIDIILEYGGEWLIMEQDHENYTNSSSDTREVKNDLIGLMQFQFKKDLYLNVLGQYTLDSGGGTLMGQLDYKGIENIELELAGQYFLAPEESDYYYWRHNHRLLASVKYSF